MEFKVLVLCRAGASLLGAPKHGAPSEAREPLGESKSREGTVLPFSLFHGTRSTGLQEITFASWLWNPEGGCLKTCYQVSLQAKHFWNPVHQFMILGQPGQEDDVQFPILRVQLYGSCLSVDCSGIIIIIIIITIIIIIIM